MWLEVSKNSNMSLKCLLATDKLFKHHNRPLQHITAHSIQQIQHLVTSLPRY